MKKIKTISSHVLPLKHENIDTDQIIPAMFLKTTVREGIGKYFFHSWRQNKNSVFLDPKHKGAKILLAGRNFGIGSSREHAVWATQDYGFEAIISSSFGDIFYNNSLKNGLLPIKLEHNEVLEIFQIIESDHETIVEIYLEKEEINLPKHNKKYKFQIDPFRKQLLLKGTDELGYMLSLNKEITKYEKNHK